MAMGKVITFPGVPPRAPEPDPAPYVRPPRQAHTKGAKYEETRDLDLAIIAKRIRKELAAAFGKGWKFTVQIKRYSGGQSLNVHAVKAPYTIIEPGKDRDVGMIQWQLNSRGEKARAKAEAIVDAYNYNNSDSMTDYFDVRFYGDTDFGRLADQQWKELQGKYPKVHVTFLDYNGKRRQGRILRQDGRHYVIEDKFGITFRVPIGNVGDVHAGGKKRRGEDVSIGAVANAMRITDFRWGKRQWYDIPAVSRIIDAAVRKGWARRQSMTQVEWTEKGVALARQWYATHPHSSRARRHSPDNPAYGREVLRRASTSPDGNWRHAGGKRRKAPSGLARLAADLNRLTR